MEWKVTPTCTNDSMSNWWETILNRLLFLIFIILHYLLKEIQVAVPGQDYSSHKNSATHSIPASVSRIFVGPNNGIWLPIFEIFLCAHKMLMHVTAHGGCADSITKSHWKQTLGEKSLASLGNWTCTGIVPGFSAQQQCSTKWVPPFLPPPTPPPNLNLKVLAEEC